MTKTKKCRGEKKSLSFPPPWEFQTLLSTLRAPDPFLLLQNPGLVINLPRNWCKNILLENMLSITFMPPLTICVVPKCKCLVYAKLKKKENEIHIQKHVAVSSFCIFKQSHSYLCWTRSSDLENTRFLELMIHWSYCPLQRLHFWKVESYTF